MGKTFICSDESINSYGYRVLVSGIDLGSFKKNPVMLFNHDSMSWGGDIYNGPIGRWENIRKENGQLLADAVIDMDDEKGKIIGNKIEKDFIRAASIGFKVLKVSEDAADMLPGQTRPTVTKCELVEISVVDIPANKNALALYDQSGNRIELKDEAEFESAQLSLINHNPIQSSNIMKLKLTSDLVTLAALFGKTIEPNQTLEVEMSEAQLSDINAKLEKLADVETALANEKLAHKASTDSIAALAATVDVALAANKIEAGATADLSAKTGLLVAELAAANQTLSQHTAGGQAPAGTDADPDAANPNAAFLSEGDEELAKLKASQKQFTTPPTPKA
jgi:HK97 family phage prohead protease